MNEGQIFDLILPSTSYTIISHFGLDWIHKNLPWCILLWGIQNFRNEAKKYFYGDYNWHDKAQWARVETFITSTDLDWDTWTRSFHPKPPGCQNLRAAHGSSSPPLRTPQSSPCCSPPPLLRWRASPPPSPPGRWGSRKRSIRLMIFGELIPNRFQSEFSWIKNSWEGGTALLKMWFRREH